MVGRDGFNLCEVEVVGNCVRVFKWLTLALASGYFKPSPFLAMVESTVALGSLATRWFLLKCTSSKTERIRSLLGMQQPSGRSSLDDQERHEFGSQKVDPNTVPSGYD